MAWTKIEPYETKKDAKTGVSASVLAPKRSGGPPVLRISLAAAQMSKIGKGASCVVEADGDLVRLSWRDGDHRVVGGPGGAGRIDMPRFDPVPREPAASFPCPIVEQTTAHLVVQLPVAAWAAPRVVRPAKARASAPPSPPAPAQPPGAGDKIDPVAYLTKKGHRVEPLAGGRFQVDGDPYTAAAVVAKINVYRCREGLPSINSDRIQVAA